MKEELLPRDDGGIRSFIHHLNSIQPLAGRFKSVFWIPEQSTMPRALLTWLENNGGPFEFSFDFKAGGEDYSGALEVSPSLFLNHQKECKSCAEETWIEGDPLEKESWLDAFPFAALGNGDFLALSKITPLDAPVIYLSHDSCSEVIAPSLDSFAKNWGKLCYIGPEISILEPFLDPETGYLNGGSVRAKNLREKFRLG